jgi:D-alanyl-D-alanine carboxypeptidase (penicillin-binding protein 5/6)
MKNGLDEFTEFLKNNRQRQINFLLAIALFLIFPVRNEYSDLQITPRRPPIREINIQLSEPGDYPINVTGRSAPYLTAYSAVVIDPATHSMIYQKNPDVALLPASTTKIMTGLVVLDHYSLDEVLTVNEVNGYGQSMKLKQSEQISVENLLYGLLVQSGNDAAYVLAENYPGGLSAFVEEMNQRAKKMHLANTHFTNPAGIDDYNHLSTAHDLAILAAEAIKDPDFARFIATKEIEVTDVTGEEKHLLKNINQLLGKVEGMKGIKTGWTINAGECLVSLVERNGREVITVVLSSEDRFGETEKLVNWVYNNFQWEAIPATPQ